jgi:hypothetical protein
MDQLPTCDILEELPKNFKVSFRSDTDEYIDLVKFISEIVGSDCWAFVVNDEVIFNGYVEQTFVDKLTDTIYKDKIIENPRSILMHINREDKDTTIEIYMFQNHPYKYVINYSNKIYSIKRYISEAFDKAYPKYEYSKQDLKKDD